MKRILLLSTLGHEAKRIQGDLADSIPGAHVTLRAPDVPSVSRCISGGVDLVVINQREYDPTLPGLPAYVRRLDHRCPILLLAMVDGRMAYQAIAESGGVVLLEKPFEKKDLIGIARKLARGSGVSQRVHRRYYTNERAVIEKEGSTLPSRMKNISEGGALFELDGFELLEGQVDIKEGDILRLSFDFKQAQRQRRLRARVVWCEQPSTSHGVVRLGVSFLKDLTPSL